MLCLVQTKLKTSFSIVVITTIVVAATSAAISNRFDGFSAIGGIIGSSISSGFLLLLGAVNIYILYKAIRSMQALLVQERQNQRRAQPPYEDEDLIGSDVTQRNQTSGIGDDFRIQGGGCLVYVLKGMMKLVDR
jgi:nickel/cobalt transporter (NiCoT) family protein